MTGNHLLCRLSHLSRIFCFIILWTSVLVVMLVYLGENSVAKDSFIKKSGGIHSNIMTGSVSSTGHCEFNKNKYSWSQYPPVAYIPPKSSNTSQPGKVMNISADTIRSLGLLDPRLSVLSRSNVDKFVVVTAASHDHFKESTDAIASIQANLPGHTIYYYDIGLNGKDIKRLKSYCGITYKKFNFSSHPPHMRHLSTYAFKPLIIQEVLQEHKAVMWIDASIRILNKFSLTYDQILKTNGFLQFDPTEYMNTATTNPSMFDYIPTDIIRQRDVMQLGSGAVYIFNNAHLYWNILYWWCICALEPNCIAPMNSKLRCHFNQKEPWKHAGCHRFDQSAINILASNVYGYDHKTYLSSNHVHLVERKPTNLFNIKICKNQTSIKKEN